MEIKQDFFMPKGVTVFQTGQQGLWEAELRAEGASSGRKEPALGGARAETPEGRGLPCTR